MDSEYRASARPTKVVQGVGSRWWTSAIHLVPVGLSALLLWLSYTCWYWFPETELNLRLFHADAANVLNWLQLAAKLYEIVVVASMATITVKAYKRSFVEDGIPLGLLSAAYRVGDVFVLLSSTFWRGLGYANWRQPSKLSGQEIKLLLLAAFFIVNTLLSQLVGPASAILIIPELDWFPLPGAFSRTAMPIFYETDAVHVWPTTVNDSLWVVDNNTIPVCRLERANFVYECPAAGFADIYTWAAGWEFSNLPDNITFQDPSGTVSRRLDMRNDSALGTFVTTPTALTAKTLGQFKAYVRSRNVGAISQADRWKLTYTKESINYQPLVQAKCHTWNTKTSTPSSLKNMSFPSAEINCYDDAENKDSDCMTIRGQLAGLSVNQDFAKIRDNVTYWFGATNAISKEAMSGPSTLLFAASLPYYSDGVIEGVRVVGCSYMAHWIPTTPEIDPSNTDYIKTNISKLDVFFSNDTSAKKGKKKPTVGSVINLDWSYLPYLDVSQTDDDTKNDTQEMTDTFGRKTADVGYSVGSILLGMTMINNTGSNYLFGPGSNFKGSSADDTVQLVIEKLTGSVLTDALARTAASTGAYLILEPARNNSVMLDQLFIQQGPNSYDLELFKNGTLSVPGQFWSNETYVKWSTIPDLITQVRKSVVTVDFDAQQYGYGFGQPGPPMRFALTVIITYLGLLLVYWFVTLVTLGKTVKPWDDLQDLIALAWASPPPPEMKGQGARIVDKELWREPVSVRARDNHVTLVLGDDRFVMDKLRKNGSYY